MLWNKPSKLGVIVQRSALIALLAASPSSLVAKNMSSNTFNNKEATTLSGALAEGTTALDFRMRLENVREQNTPRGQANTIGTTLSYNSAVYKGLSGLLEFNNTSSYFTGHHNAGMGVTPAHAARSVIADPRGSSMTRGLLELTGITDTTITIGRQTIQLDDQRFVGNNDFRQMPTSFDAFTINTSSFPGFEWFYGYVAQINTNYQGAAPLIGQRKLNTHLINATWDGWPAGEIVLYSYFNKDKVQATNTSDTYGLRLDGEVDLSSVSFLYAADFARQRGSRNNPIHYTAHYSNFEAGVKIQSVIFKAGYQSLQGDKTAAGKSFQTPLASTHGINGAADLFIITPNQGLKDFSIAVVGEAFNTHANVAYHQFRAEAIRSNRYGHEWDAGISRDLNDNMKVGLEYAKFIAKNPSFKNTDKFWLSILASY